MKKIALFTVLVCVLFLAACGSGDDYEPLPNAILYTHSGDALPQPSITDVTTVTATEEPDDYDAGPVLAEPLSDTFYFTLRGNTILLDQEIDEVLALLGEPLDTFDRPSCAFDGIDRFFLFAGVQIQTYPINGTDRVHTILLLDDSVTTANGIFLGSTFSDVVAAYGYDYEYAYNMYSFVRNGTMLRFLINDGLVQTISYELITD